jgi:hypothetical protein
MVGQTYGMAKPRQVYPTDLVDPECEQIAQCLPAKSSTGTPNLTIVNTLAIDPLTPASVYAGKPGGVYKSIMGRGS